MNKISNKSSKLRIFLLALFAVIVAATSVAFLAPGLGANALADDGTTTEEPGGTGTETPDTPETPEKTTVTNPDKLDQFATATAEDGGTVITGINAAYELGENSTVKIPSGVTAIGANAFENQTNITALVLSSEVTSIGDSAFAGTSLTQVTLPDAVVNVGANAFKTDTLADVYLPNNTATAYGADAFTSTALANIFAPNYGVYAAVTTNPATTPDPTPDAGTESARAARSNGEGSLGAYETQLTYKVKVFFAISGYHFESTEMWANRAFNADVNGGTGYALPTAVCGVGVEGFKHIEAYDGTNKTYTYANALAKPEDLVATNGAEVIYSAVIDAPTLTLKDGDGNELTAETDGDNSGKIVISYGDVYKVETTGYNPAYMEIVYVDAEGNTSYTAPKAMGTYTIKIQRNHSDYFYFTFNDADNASNSPAYIEFAPLVIEAAETKIAWVGLGGAEGAYDESGTDPAPIALTFYYNNSPVSPLAYLKENNQILPVEIYSVAADDTETKVDSAVNAGKYVAKIPDGTTVDGYDLTDAAVSWPFVIEQIEVAFKWTETTNSYDYDGEAHRPAFEATTDFNDGNVTLEYTVEAASGSSLTDGKAVNAGSYTAKVTLTNPNYKLVDATGTDNSIAEDADGKWFAAFEFTINPAEDVNITIHWDASSLKAPYNGNSQLPDVYYTVDGDDSGTRYTLVEHLTLAAADATTSLTNGKAVGAGTYTVSVDSAWLAANGYTVTNTADLSKTFKIEKKELKIEWTGTVLTYNGAAQNASVLFPEVEGASLSLTYYSDAECTKPLNGAPTDAGEYYVKATVNGLDSNNYTVSGELISSFKINKKTVDPVNLNEDKKFASVESAIKYIEEKYGKDAVIVTADVVDGEIVVDIELRNDNFEFGENVKSTVRFGLTSGSIPVADVDLNKTLIVALSVLGGIIVLLLLIMLLVVVSRRRRSESANGANGEDDDDGFYDPYYGER